jgi:hypothetical protein
MIFVGDYSITLQVNIEVKTAVLNVIRLLFFLSSTIGNKSIKNERWWGFMSEIVATVTITLATLIAMTIIGVYAIKIMTKIANKDNDK